VVCAWRLVQHGDQCRLTLAHPGELFFGCEDDLYGPFASHRKATDALRALVDAHQLCPGLLGLEKRRPGKPCFASQVQRCSGACSGAEALAAHAGRLRAALLPWQLPPWPHAGPIALQEGSGWHVLHQWCYLGSVAAGDHDAAQELARAGAVFDRDVYRILKTCLAAPQAVTYRLD
jgi:DNA polymerase-3 subunit epsilon